MSESIQEVNTWKILFDRLNALEKKVFQPERETMPNYQLECPQCHDHFTHPCRGSAFPAPEMCPYCGRNDRPPNECCPDHHIALERCCWKNSPGCKCNNNFQGGGGTCGNLGHHFGCDCHLSKPAPLSKVEERIRFIIDQVTAANIGGIDNFKEELRALVVLAKDSVPECDGDH